MHLQDKSVNLDIFIFGKMGRFLTLHFHAGEVDSNNISSASDRIETDSISIVAIRDDLRRDGMSFVRYIHR